MILKGYQIYYFSTKITIVKFSRCTLGLLRVLYFATCFSFKLCFFVFFFFFINTRYRNSGFQNQIETYCKLTVELKEKC